VGGIAGFPIKLGFAETGGGLGLNFSAAIAFAIIFDENDALGDFGGGIGGKDFVGDNLVIPIVFGGGVGGVLTFCAICSGFGGGVGGNFLFSTFLNEVDLSGIDFLSLSLNNNNGDAGKLIVCRCSFGVNFSCDSSVLGSVPNVIINASFSSFNICKNTVSLFLTSLNC